MIGLYIKPIKDSPIQIDAGVKCLIKGIVILCNRIIIQYCLLVQIIVFTGIVRLEVYLGKVSGISGSGIVLGNLLLITNNLDIIILKIRRESRKVL